MSAIAVAVPGHTPAAHLDAKEVTRTDQLPVLARHAENTRAQVARAARTDAALPMITVRAGESISSVSQASCGTPEDWTGVYTASRWAHQTAKNANDLRVGQQLTIMCKQVPSMASRAYTPPPPPPAPAHTLAAHYDHVNHLNHEARTVSDTVHGSSAHVAAPAAAAVGGSSAAVSGHVSASGYEGCVIERESGGNAQIWNPSGHWGLYQFDEGTWVSGGGSAASFGNASATEQHQVFENVYAARGTSPWTPSDGC